MLFFLAPSMMLAVPAFPWVTKLGEEKIMPGWYQMCRLLCTICKYAFFLSPILLLLQDDFTF
jgi:hypothetical protein